MSWLFAAAGRPPGFLRGIGRKAIQFQKQVLDSLVKPVASGRQLPPTRSYAHLNASTQSARFKTSARSPRHSSSYKWAVHNRGIRPQAVVNQSTHRVGLQSARNFSSTQPVFAFINNAPLITRAVAQELLDGKDWRAIKTQRGSLFARFSKDQEGSIDSSVRRLPVETPAISDASVLGALSEADTSLLFDVALTPASVHIQLVIQAQPQIPERIAQAMTAGNSSRLLDRSTVHALQDWQMISLRHTKRVNNLIDRLDHAGALVHGLLVDAPGSYGNTRKFVFDVNPEWSRERFDRLLQFWTGESSPAWLDVVDWDDPEDGEYLVSNFDENEMNSAEPSVSSDGDYIDGGPGTPLSDSSRGSIDFDQIHDNIASTFILPRAESSFASSFGSPDTDDLCRFIESIDSERHRV